MEYTMEETIKYMQYDWVEHWYAKYPSHFSHIKDELRRDFCVNWLLEHDYSDDQITEIMENI